MTDKNLKRAIKKLSDTIEARQPSASVHKNGDKDVFYVNIEHRKNSVEIPIFNNVEQSIHTGF